MASDSQSDARNSIAAYPKAQAPGLAAICDKLQVEIDKGIPSSTSRIWHGSPVWFIGENPVVGYSVRQKGVDLMFWSGQLFDEPLLKAVGKDKAARVSFQDESEINFTDLRRWLKSARTIIFDYVGMYGRKRQPATGKLRKHA
jgi:hypothetical protein